MLSRADDRALGGGNDLYAIISGIALHALLQVTGLFEHPAACLLGDKEHIDERKDLLDRLSGIFLTPEVRAVVDIEGDRSSSGLESADQLHGNILHVLTER